MSVCPRNLLFACRGLRSVVSEEVQYGYERRVARVIALN